MAQAKKGLFPLGLAIRFLGLCLKSPEICIELTVRHVFQLRLDVFLFVVCCQLQESRVINLFIVKKKLIFETEFVSVKTKLDCEMLMFLFIFYHAGCNISSVNF